MTGKFAGHAVSGGILLQCVLLMAAPESVSAESAAQEIPADTLADRGVRARHQQWLEVGAGRGRG